MNVQMIVLFVVLTCARGQDRQITSILNPGCPGCRTLRNPLYYVRAEGAKDTIHQLWDFTDNHVPAMVFAIGSPNSTLNVSWSKMTLTAAAWPRPIKFEFSEPPSYSFAAAIDKIIEYNDLKDNGYFDPHTSDQKSHSLQRRLWQVIDSLFTDKEAKVLMRGSDLWIPDIIEMKLDLLPFKDYSVDLPHLIHTANSTLVDIRLINQTESPEFNSSRFAVHFVLVSTDPKGASWNMDMRKSMDDEHTPGVFEIIEIISGNSSSGSGGFIQFRPVGYTEPERGVSSSTNAYISSFNTCQLPEASILPQFYSDYSVQTDSSERVIQDVVISFGLAGDGFYKQHNFTAWSFTIGYGIPPLESFSLLVAVIIAIGLGVPVLLALSGVVYALARRCKQTNPPTRFTNDE